MGAFMGELRPARDGQSKTGDFTGAPLLERPIRHLRRHRAHRAAVLQPLRGQARRELQAREIVGAGPTAGLETEAAQRAKDLAIGQHHGRADVGANGKREVPEQRRGGGVLARVGDVLRQAAVHHPLAPALFQRLALALGKQIDTGRLRDLAENALAIHELGDEHHVHAHALAQQLEHLADGLVQLGVGLVGRGHQQLGHLDLDVVRAEARGGEGVPVPVHGRTL
jgi:hypothetical protein